MADKKPKSTDSKSQKKRVEVVKKPHPPKKEKSSEKKTTGKNDINLNEISNELHVYLKVILSSLLSNLKDYFKKFNLFRFLEDVFIKNIQIKILSFVISVSIFVYVKLQDVEEKTVPIKLNTIKNEELAFVNTLPETITLFLSGTRTDLDKLDDNQVKAKLDLTDIETAGAYERSPNIEGLPPSLQIINFTPKTIDVELSTLERKLLSIEPELVGKPHRDFDILSIRSKPRKIWAFGPKDILQDITKLSTEPIDIDGIKTSKEVDVELNKNIHPNIKVDLNRKIKINVALSSKFYQEKVKSVFELNVDFAEGSDLSWDNFFYISNVEFRIPVELSEEFDPIEKIRFYANVAEITKEGQYEVDILHDKLEGLKIINYEPKKAKLEITKNEF